MNVNQIRYWNYSYLTVDGKMFGPMLHEDAELAVKRGGNVTKSQMLSYIKAARIGERYEIHAVHPLPHG